MEAPAERPSPAKLRAYFSARNLPPAPLRISPCEVIADPAKFVQSHLSILEAQPDPEDPRPRTPGAIQRFKAPYYFRLLRFKAFLENEKN